PGPSSLPEPSYPARERTMRPARILAVANALGVRASAAHCAHFTRLDGVQLHGSSWVDPGVIRRRGFSKDGAEPDVRTHRSPGTNSHRWYWRLGRRTRVARAAVPEPPVRYRNGGRGPAAPVAPRPER